LSIIKIPFFDEWFRSLLSGRESTVILLYHPELLFVKEFLINEYYNLFLSSLVFSLYELSTPETFYNPTIVASQLLFLVALTALFISYYFSYFTNPNTEETTVDNDYLSASLVVESEKEITSFDDIILALVILMYVFG
jgi:hypothetical protein